MQVLLVRLSSMGDMLHSLPAVTDAAAAKPHIEFDWLVDQAFAEIPAWHPSIRNVIACPPRRWGQELWSSLRNGSLSLFLKKARRQNYDRIIDLQAEIKSAVAASIAKGIRCSYDGRSVHEYGAQLAYQKKYPVPKNLHSIERMRRLMAYALDYSVPSSAPDFGIDRSRFPLVSLNLPEPYAVFIHSTSWESKCWPESRWQTLLSMAVDAGLSVVFPWGNRSERERAHRISAGNKKAIVLPDLTISEKAAVISRASATVGCDTGLSHIAAALGIPSVTLYGPTDPLLIGATGKNQLHMASDFECVKCHRPICTYRPPSQIGPACFDSITAEKVMAELQALLEKSESNVISTVP